MSVWLTIPSARPPEECEPILKQWRKRGYKIALWRDEGRHFWMGDVEIVMSRHEYPGYGEAVNSLIHYVSTQDLDAEWFIAAGDDTLPDPTHTAQEIAWELGEHFATERRDVSDAYSDGVLITHGYFGVMQPTGDRWHEGVGGFSNAPIDRVAGSAWYGREYCRRMYGGQGPLFSGYKHMYVDEEAQEVAIKMGVFWQRRDLTQKHCHWGRGETDRSVVTMRPGLIPPHLEKWNTDAHWQEAKALFQSRKAAGFPGHEPIA